MGSKVVARETIKAVRKNVLVKSGKMVGGGDVSRKKKLLVSPLCVCLCVCMCLEDGGGGLVSYNVVSL